MHRLPDANTVKYGNSVTFASCITVQLVTLLTVVSRMFIIIMGYSSGEREHVVRRYKTQ